jgi:outer membrane receptor protein involved in Fe transport
MTAVHDRRDRCKNSELNIAKRLRRTAPCASSGFGQVARHALPRDRRDPLHFNVSANGTCAFRENRGAKTESVKRPRSLFPPVISRRRSLLLFFCCTTAWAATNDPVPTTTDQQMDAVNVRGDRYQSARPDIPLGMLGLLGTHFGPFSLSGPNLMSTTVVTATRIPEVPERIAATTRIFDETTLRRIPSASLDGALRSVPGFSLFRRSDSFSANPTAQGVSLRGLGPSGASRSLVLFDGVPLNDPFGGWVAWTKVPHEAVARVEVVPGGGASAWGNATLGGVIQIFSLPARTELIVVDRPPSPVAIGSRGTARFAVALGDFGTYRGEAAFTRPVGRGIVQILARDFRTDGFSLVAPERRGTIDIDAWSRHRWLTARWRAPIGKSDKMEITTTARTYEESRGNGTPYQQNRSREKFASVAVSALPTDNFAWNAVVYGQDQSFASTFSSVNASRTAETPASDQFDVPSRAFGAAWTGVWKTSNGGRTSVGVDSRWVDGETRENFSLSGGTFTRQRVAGGTQSMAGLFALREQRMTDTLRVTLGARLDRWRESDGHRREVDRSTGAALRDDHYADRDDLEFSPSLGLVWNAGNRWRLRAAGQQAFRRPTLNELYRPFRQGANITETNPALKTERVTSGEMGVEWSVGKPFESFVTATSASAGAKTNRQGPAPAPNPPISGLAFNATAFWNELDDAVGNVTLARGPGTFPLFGFIPAGGVGRQRLNLERIRVRGLEAAATWRVSRGFSLNAAALFNDPIVRQADIAPQLVGKRVAQVPRRSATLGATWLAPGAITVTPRIRWIDRQFEDDENTLRLGEVVIADLGLSRALTGHLELFLTLENLGNARIETGRSLDGIVNIGTPRLFLAGLRGSW